MPIETGFVPMPDGVRLYYERLADPEARSMLIFPNGLYLRADFAFLSEGRSVLFYDPRQRGRSDAVDRPTGDDVGIQRDVEDLEAVRRHVGVERIDLIGHSYVGLVLALYAARYPQHTGRVVLLGPVAPEPTTQYPPELTANDRTLQDVFGKLAQLQNDPEPADPEERCRRFWSVLKPIYVADAKDANRISWERCDLPNERNFMRYWTAHLLPSMQRLDLPAGYFARVTSPVLIVHGRKDRSAPYGGALDWMRVLPDARLVSVEQAAHAPWIEEPALVFGGVRRFLTPA